MMLASFTTVLKRAWEFVNDLWGVTNYLEATLSAHASIVDAGLRGLAALLLITCMLAFSVRVVRRLLPDVGVPLRWTAIIGSGMWIATVGFHALRTLGLFRLWAALACAIALGAAALYYQPARVPLRWALRRELRALVAVARLVRRSRYGFITCVLFGVASLYGLRTLIIPPLGWDTLTYHGPRAAFWLQTGQFTLPSGPGPLDLYRHFFSGSEVLTAWAMLPFHSDVLVNASTVVQWLGVFVASWALARGAGLREPFAATSAGVVTLIPTMQLELGTAYTEVALCASLIGGAALAVELLRRPRVQTALVSAALLGLAAGIKLPGAPPVAIVLLAVALKLLLLRDRKLQVRIGYVAAVGLIALLPSLPWPLNAWYETGYPLSPMPVEVLGLKLGEVSPSLRWYQDQYATPYIWAQEKQAGMWLLSPLGTTNEALGSLALIPVLLMPFGALALLRRRPRGALLLLGAALPPLIMHFSKSLTTPRILWAVSVSRYLLLFMAFAVPLSLAWCRATGPSHFYRRVLLIFPLFYTFFFIRWGWGGWEYRELVVLTLALVGCGTFVRWCLARSSRAGIAATLGCTILLSWLIQSRQDLTRHGAFNESFAMHPWPHYWAPVLPLIDQPAEPRKVAITGGESQAAHDWHFYAFMGARLQNEIHYVPPTKDGRVAHFGPYGTFTQNIDRDAWLARLRERGITEVLTFFPRSIEQQWMDENPAMFQRLAGDVNWALFKVLR